MQTIHYGTLLMLAHQSVLHNGDYWWVGEHDKGGFGGDGEHPLLAQLVITGMLHFIRS
jgi:hypothetical protein